MCVPMFVPEKELHTAYRVRRRRRRRRWRRKRRRRRWRATTMPIPRLGPRFTEMFSVGLVLGFRVWASFAANLQVVFKGFVWRLRFGCSYGLGCATKLKVSLVLKERTVLATEAY
jgi:hypothetical protein